MVKSYVLKVVSQKGGVGKTTMAVNLATALALSNYKVLLFDADFANPSVGFHLGMYDVNAGASDVASGKTSLRNAIRKALADRTERRTWKDQFQELHAYKGAPDQADQRNKEGEL